MSRRQQDPIAQHSAQLCQSMNGHPAVVLSYARYFGEYPAATSATITTVDQDGFDIVCQDSGEDREIRVTFGHSLHAVSQVKDAFMTLAKEAEKALRSDDPNSQGLMPDSPSATLPEADWLSTMLLMVVLVVFYLDLYPNTTSPALQWVLQTIGTTWIHRIVLLVTGLHCFESLVSLYFTLVVGQGFFSLADAVQWCVLILFLGYSSLFKLVTLANRQRTRAKAKAE